MKIAIWRWCFILAAVFILIGGPQHPRGTMVEMLADPKWIPSHTLVLIGFLLMLAGLILYRRAEELPPLTRRWAGLATIGTALQAIEMVLHTAATVDHANLVAGRHTPVLTTHLSLAVFLYPIFGLAMIGLIIASAGDNTLGSRWIAWIGIIGALGHGAAAPLVVGFDKLWARSLFPLIVLLALWFLLVGCWPRTKRMAASKP